ncbi:MAG: YeeE/YedE family protein [Flavobacteriales bacterium]|nr:YeeE/YedE family protein [Flavobacteriales bacterium]
MKFLTYLLIGILFGITMFKSEAASWFRIYEMFHFKSFHMYGIIGVAVVIGVIGVAIMKKTKMKTFSGEPVKIQPKEKSFARYIIGGTIFGLGWGLSGACPGPMFTLFGSGFVTILIVIAFATLGTLV